MLQNFEIFTYFLVMVYERPEANKGAKDPLKILISLVKIIPQNFVSWLTGLLVRIHFPLFLRGFTNGLFVKIFGIDLSDASKSLDEFETMEDVFTRSLQPDARPIQSAICSPVDGKLVWSIPVKDESEALQVKGITMSLKSLVFGSTEPGTSFKPGWYSTVYLAPHNYHRVHSPVAGQLEKIHYIPGKLWPVNEIFTSVIPGLFTENERLVFEVTIDENESQGKVYIVMVGALNVGRMTSPFWPEFASNDWLKQNTGHLAHTESVEPKIRLESGDEIGTFMLGSTVVIVYDQDLGKSLNLKECRETRTVRMGQSLLNNNL